MKNRVAILHFLLSAPKGRPSRVSAVVWQAIMTAPLFHVLGVTIEFISMDQGWKLLVTFGGGLRGGVSVDMCDEVCVTV